MLREHARYDIFVEHDAKGVRDPLGDAQVAEARIALLQRDDGGDEFRRGPFGAGLGAPRRKRKRAAGISDLSTLRNALGTHDIVWSARVRTDRAR